MRDRLITALSGPLPTQLAGELVDDYLQMRLDAASRTLGRTAPGKFVESVVQALQFLASGSYTAKPAVDHFLRTVESETSLPDGLRICAARIARSMYALRSKRSIAHKGEVDPNSYDLSFLVHGAQWILAELVRACGSLSMEEAGALTEALQAPFGGVVEDFEGRRLVLADLSAPKEVLVLLHSRYPEVVPTGDIVASLDRKNPRTVKNAVRQLWREKLLEGGNDEGYRLTRLGLVEATAVVKDMVEPPAV